MYNTMETNNRAPEMSFLNWLTLLFIGLKLTNFIDWSWWWVLSPIWLTIVLALGILFSTGFFRGFIRGLNKQQGSDK